MAELKEIAVVGGTGAQGKPVVEALAGSGRYRVRVLTRNLESSRAKQLAALPNVTLLQGAQDNLEDLHKIFKGVYGAWVNTDGFTLGEKDELFYGFRAYEIARSEGLQHYVWANIEYAMDAAKFDEKYHCGHMESKGRVGKFILALGQDVMKSTLFSTGPYMDMLHDGMFVPNEQPDGSFLWANPSRDDTKLPLIALCDVGIYNLWIFDNPSESAGLDVSVVTDNVSFAEIARIFTEVTGTPAAHKAIPWEAYAPLAEPYPGASVNWALGPDAPRDKSVMSWADNFGAWWRYWGDGITPQRDEAFLDRIHPKRIKSLADWMKHVGYNGKRQNVLKMVEDWAIKNGAPPRK
ncbi:NmrA family protein [Dactylonectria estremocensis]|uniref:NmrA family protein n=1 Tax=Dactylonectria estremocensis TaxID=1079267 RepID=A0A9P9ISX2_9HYPO|nr:NmrA family protein [Dactylonectria estremocensis]